MKRRWKGFFITAIVFAAISTIIFAYFLSATIQLLNTEVEDVGEAIALPFVLIILLVYWMIAGAVSGIISAVFSGLGIRYTKWSIFLLVVSILYVAAPFIFILFASIFSGGSEEPEVQSAMYNCLSLIM